MNPIYFNHGENSGFTDLAEWQESVCQSLTSQLSIVVARARHKARLGNWHKKASLKFSPSPGVNQGWESNSISTTIPGNVNIPNCKIQMIIPMLGFIDIEKGTKRKNKY